MADFLSPRERSDRMARIRGKDTAPEITLRRGLHAAGFRFRLHARQLPGRPDLIFPKYRTVVFVHGCFWHQHAACNIGHVPASNSAFWTAKFEANRRRDLTAQQRLAELGWRVIVVWECELSTKARSLETINKVAEAIRQQGG